MQILRTPDERFVNLPNWSYDPTYTDVTQDQHTLRVAGAILRGDPEEVGDIGAPSRGARLT